MPKKSRILHITKYLRENSDEENPVTISDILIYLKSIGIETGRRTIPNDIDEMIEIGIDVVKVKSTQNKYFIGNRHFETPEIKLLLNAVYSSKLITPKKSIKLAEKIKDFTSKYQRTEFSEEFHIADIVKPTNEKVLISIDLIHKSINEKKQITFGYFDYLPTKEKVLKNNGDRYKISPYSLVWNEDKYYLFGFSEVKNKIVTFRVDRMSNILEETVSSIPSPPDFNIAEFCKQVFEMYDGTQQTVTIKCKNHLMKVVIDKFGEDVYTEIYDNDWFVFKADVSASKTFYGWLFQFTGEMKLLSPLNLVNEYKKMLEISLSDF